MGRNKITFCKGHTVNKGRVQTAEQKEKIRLSLLARQERGGNIGRPKGGTPWNKGMKRENGDPIPPVTPMSEEGRKRVSELMKSRMKGVRASIKTEFKKGMKPWNIGKKWPKETKERMSEAHKNISAETRQKMSKAKKGKILTAEHIKKVLTRRTPTSLEKKFLGIVEKNGLPYRFVGDGSFMIGRKNPDFINVNGEKIAIEVYARYYKLRHAETVQAWQVERERVFREYGWTAIFFDETQVNEKNILTQLGGK